jgi:hypothetical protein
LQGVEVDAVGVVRDGVAVGDDEVVFEAETLEYAVFAAGVSYDVNFSGPERVPGVVVVETQVLDSCFVEAGCIAHLIFLSEAGEIAEC